MIEMTDSNDNNRSESRPPGEPALPQPTQRPADHRQATADQPPAYDPPHETSPGRPTPEAPESPGSVKGGLRAAGFGVLGFIGGIILAFLIQDLIGIIVAVDGGGFPIEVAIIIGILMPLIGTGGAAAAILIDRRFQTRRLAGEGR